MKSAAKKTPRKGASKKAAASAKQSAMKRGATRPAVASKASKLLRNPRTPKPVKSVAASALTQAAGKKAAARKFADVGYERRRQRPEDPERTKEWEAGKKRR